MNLVVLFSQLSVDFFSSSHDHFAVFPIHVLSLCQITPLWFLLSFMYLHTFLIAAIKFSTKATIKEGRKDVFCFMDWGHSPPWRGRQQESEVAGHATASVRNSIWRFCRLHLEWLLSPSQFPKRWVKRVASYPVRLAIDISHHKTAQCLKQGLFQLRSSETNPFVKGLASAANYHLFKCQSLLDWHTGPPSQKFSDQLLLGFIDNL